MTESVTSPVSSDLNARSAAVGDLFSAIEALMITYQALPEAERNQQWAVDAERITGEFGRHLSVARVRLSSSFVSSPATAQVADTEDRS